MNETGRHASAPPCILIVDDDRRVRAVVRRLVEMWGYASDEAVNGTKALERIAAGDVALVLTDYEMPGGDGLSLIHAVVARGRGQAGPTPLILVSGFGAEDIAPAAVAAGALAVFPKPFNIPLLRIAIDLFVGRRDARG
jgi:CheY-like chemotaxis protein